MKKVTLEEQLKRIKVLMERHTYYDAPDNYADETYGDERPQGEEIMNNEPIDNSGADDAMMKQWINDLEIDKLLNSGWEAEIVDGVTKRGGLYSKTNRYEFKSSSNPCVVYRIYNESDDELFIRFNAYVADSWPEQKWGLEQEPIAAGMEMAVDGIDLVEPDEKRSWSGEDYKVIRQLDIKDFDGRNPNFSGLGYDVVDSGILVYDGDI